MIRKIWNWLRTSHRYLHLLGGLALGVMSDGWYMALVVALSAAATLEYKDYMYNGRRLTAWDWIDFGLTIAGAAVGFAIKSIII